MANTRLRACCYPLMKSHQIRYSGVQIMALYGSLPTYEAHPRSPPRIAYQPSERFCQISGLPGRHQQSVFTISDQVGDSSHSGGNYREA